MSNARNQIGFSQRVRIEWLEQTANLVLAGSDKAAVAGRLQDLMKDKVSIGGTAERGNREKIITILMKVWVNPPGHLDSLRLAGLDLLTRLRRDDRLVVHWGMVTAVYPFWGTVATQVGRLVKLQGSVTAPQVQRRIREQYGERDTVSRAARRVLRSFHDWGVLKESGVHGVYTQGLTIAVEQPELVSWIVEASLRARRDGSAALSELVESASLFPFQLKSVSAANALRVSSRVEIVRHGLDEELVVLPMHRPASAGSAA
jgi:hypothetical protein